MNLLYTVQILGFLFLVQCKYGYPQISNQKESTASPTHSSWFDSIEDALLSIFKDVQGVKIYRSFGESNLTAKTTQSDELVASGTHSLDRFGLSIYSRSTPGWKVRSNIGLLYLQSELKDFNSALSASMADLGESIDTRCQWLDDLSDQPCDLVNRYQVTTWNIYTGIWSGYEGVWPSQSKDFIFILKGGLSWNPLSVTWSQIEFGNSLISSTFDLYFTHTVLFDSSLIFEFPTYSFALSLDFHFGSQLSLTHKPAIEFMGREFCDSEGLLWVISKR